VYLSDQQAIAASAAPRFSIAKRRAFVAMSSPRPADSDRNTRFHRAIPLSCQKIAAIVWSAVRVVLASDPTALTSSKSFA
jgi:hypothetical protein